jgi:hypothetical protein
MGNWILRGRWGISGSFLLEGICGNLTGSASLQAQFHFWRRTICWHRGWRGFLRGMSISATKVELAGVVNAGHEGAIDEDYDAVL